MADHSAIEWTDSTWNPVRGCSLVSPGCTNCYAMRQAHRHANAGGAYEGLTKISKGGPVWTGEVRTVPQLLEQPGRWRRPRRIFVNSMSDLFHEDVPDAFIAQVWQRMAWNQQHIFQILTKRPERMLAWVTSEGGDAVFAGERAEYEDSLRKHGWPPRNVWLGVSVEDQARADERIPLLLKTPAAVRWISAEPLIGQIDLSKWLGDKGLKDLIATFPTGAFPLPAHLTPRPSLDWVVVGGESGSGARPMHPGWARSLRDQCAAVGTPFFFKQWGAWKPIGNMYDPSVDDEITLDWDNEGGRTAELLSCSGARWGQETAQPPLDTWLLSRVGKKIAGRLLDGRTHNEYPA